MNARMNAPSQNQNPNDLALLLGRICMASVFLPSGIAKLLGYGKFAASLAGKTLLFGVPLPFPEGLALAAVAIEVIGPILLILGFEIRWIALIMIAFVVMANITSHRYWELEGDLRRANSTNFYKNIGLIGGLLFLYVSGAGAWSWDGWRSRRHLGGGRLASA